LIVQVTECTTDGRLQRLLLPGIEFQGWWIGLNLPAEEVIELYKDHSTHEQFHSEVEIDLDLERLPFGKFDTDNVTLHLAVFPATVCGFGDS
jgi:hypothetical protein